MTYAAWLELHNDDAIVARPTALRVYAYLVRNPRIFFDPQPVKTWLVADRLHTSKRIVRAALNLLVERGYVIEHDRAPDNVRRVTLPIERSAPVGH